MSALLNVLSGRITQLEKRFNGLLAQSQRAEVTGGIDRSLDADKATAGQAGRLIFITDGRKDGEAVGAGTGIPYSDDGTNWVGLAPANRIDIQRKHSVNQAIPTTSWTPISFDILRFGEGVSYSAGTFTFDTSGHYLCMLQVRWETFATSGRALRALRNGAQVLGYDDRIHDIQTINTVINVNATDTLVFGAFQSSGSDKDIDTLSYSPIATLSRIGSQP